MKSRSLRLRRDVLGDLSSDELRVVAGGSNGETCAASCECEPSWTCPESYTCPRSYTCPITYIEVRPTLSLMC